MKTPSAVLCASLYQQPSVLLLLVVLAQVLLLGARPVTCTQTQHAGTNDHQALIADTNFVVLKKCPQPRR
jgi:hypothetical protein